LTIADLKEWEKAIKRQEKVKFAKEVKDIMTPDGLFNVQVRQDSTVFCSKFKAFIDEHSNLLTETINIASDINEKCTMVANIFLTLSKYFDQLNQLHQIVKNDRQTEIFSWLSKTLDGSGHHL